MKILGLIDGSIYAQSVCDHIAWIAGRVDAKVEVLHVIGRHDFSSEPVNLSGNIGLGARSALLTELAELDAQKAKVAQKRGRLILEEVKSRIGQAGVQNVEVKLRNGELLETVLESEGDADLIVIGKRGEGADFAKGHLGSNVERVVRSTHKTIAVVSRMFKSPSKLLIAYDGGSMAMKIVNQVAQSPILAGLDCKLVMVGAENAENSKKLNDATVILKAAGFTPHIALVPGLPDKVINEIIEQEGYDLLAMGAYSHSRLRSLFIGSTTTEMIRSCRIPVLIFR